MQITYAFVAAIAGLASAAPSVAEERALSLGPGPLYTYPQDTNGHEAYFNLPVFSNGKKIYLGDYKLLNDAEYAPVIFTLSDSDYLLHLEPNTTGLASPPSWSNRILAEPSNAAELGADILAFSPSDNLSGYYSKWTAYASAVLPGSDDGILKGGWEYAQKTDIEGVYEAKVYWKGDLPSDKIAFLFRKGYLG